MKYLETCCCCFSARTGCLILGVLGIMGAGYSIYQESFSLAMVGEYQEVLMSQERNLAKQYEEGKLNMSEEAYETIMHLMNLMVKSLPGLFVFGLILALFNLARSVLLVVGVNYEKPVLMLPHIIAETIGTVVGLLVTVVGSLVLMIVVDFVAGFLLFVVLGIFVGLQIHFLWVAISHYKALDTKANAANYGIVYNEMPSKLY